MKFRDFLRVIEDNGFVFHRQGAGSHAIYRAIVDGEVRLVTLAIHRPSDEIKPGTLAAMIRQTGLPKSKFR